MKFCLILYPVFYIKYLLRNVIPFLQNKAKKKVNVFTDSTFDEGIYGVELIFGKSKLYKFK